MTKSERIDLGVAIAHTHTKRGVPMTFREIAAYCDCTWANIWLEEQRAIHKLKKAAFMRNEPVIRALR